MTRRHWAFVIAALALAVHVALGLALTGHRLLPGDTAAFDLMSQLRFGAGVDVVRVLTQIGSFPSVAVLVVVSAIVAARHRRRRQALTLVAGFLLVFVLVHVTKDLWARPRPPARLSHVVGLSYPSGHAAYATALIACAWVIGRRGLLAAAAVVTMFIAASRLYLHVHFLTDVVGGIALSAAIFALLLRP